MALFPDAKTAVTIRCGAGHSGTLGQYPATEVERPRFELSRWLGFEGHAGAGEEAGEEIGDDTIWPVVEVLEQAAFDDRPFNIGVVVVHSANPGGAARIALVLRRWGYRVRVASGCSDVAYAKRPPAN